MSDNDMLRRGDVLKAVDMWESDWPCTYSAILALPAVQPDAREVALREALVALQGAGSFGRTAAEKHSALEQYCMCRDAILALIDKPAHVNKTPKSEHEAGNVLTPATKGERDD